MQTSFLIIPYKDQKDCVWPEAAPTELEVRDTEVPVTDRRMGSDAA